MGQLFSLSLQAILNVNLEGPFPAECVPRKLNILKDFAGHR